jgi:hypothetical protein
LARSTCVLSVVSPAPPFRASFLGLMLALLAQGADSLGCVDRRGGSEISGDLGTDFLPLLCSYW